MRRWLIGLVCASVTGCLPLVAEAQLNVWGDLELRGYIVGERVAPNGLTYDPLFSLRADLQVGLPDTVYLFSKSIFWGQKAGTGQTNSDAGAFDFSKREFDLQVGAAWRLLEGLEARGFFYSLNNLNRGKDTRTPSGFEDGGALGGRYYWAAKTYVGVGDYLSKDLVDQAGRRFHPSLFVEEGWVYDFWRKPERAFVYGEAEFITEDPVSAKLLNSDLGIGIRPFQRFLNLEFRVGAESVYDFGVNRGRILPYGSIGVRF